MTVWFLTTAFLGNSLNQLKPTVLTDLQTQVTYACKNWFCQFHFHFIPRFFLVAMLFIILDIWENRNETANFSQKHDVELIKEQKRYPIYIIYFHTFYPRQTWYKFSTRRRTREEKISYHFAIPPKISLSFGYNPWIHFVSNWSVTL